MAGIRVKDWLPQEPWQGPPLPEFLNIRWPWYKPPTAAFWGSDLVISPEEVNPGSVEIVPRPFVVSAEIVMVRPPTRLVSDPWEEHYEARRKYSEALEVWRQAENLVNLNTQRTASACDATGDSALETAHHLRKSLSRVDDDRVEMSELVEV